MNPTYFAAIAIIGAVTVAVVATIWMRQVLASRPIAPADDARLQQLQGELSALQIIKAALETDLAVERQKASRIPSLERQLSETSGVAETQRDGKVAAERDLARVSEALERTDRQLSTAEQHAVALEAKVSADSARYESLCGEKAKLEETLAARTEALAHVQASATKTDERLRATETASRELAIRNTALERALAETNTRLDEKARAAADTARELERTRGALDLARNDLAELQAAHATLKETLAQEGKQAEEKLGLLNDAKERMTQDFKVLADELMKQHGKSFAEQNKEQISVILAPLQVKLGEFQQGLQTAHTESTKERATLVEQIRALTDTSARMTSETANLTRALKGDSQKQGAWGEMILSTILERSGLREGEEYVTQDAHTMEDGARLRPDVIVNLPGHQRMIVDAKVSLTSFEACVSAETEAERQEHLTAHMVSMRSHIKSLSSKEYQRLAEGGLDFVILFVPIEGALAAALQQDPALTSFAIEQNVTIATPTTLMTVLRTVANLWHVERRNRNAEEIADRAGKIYDKFVGFVGDLKGVGDRLAQAKTSYDAALVKLSSGNGNLVRQVEMLREMGGRTTKALPPIMLENAAVDLLPAASEGDVRA